MKLIYSLGVVLYTALIYVAFPFSQKARSWTQGRRKWISRLSEYSNSERPTIWFHCASLGEFEQGRPLIEKIKERSGETRILLTFFSPSGYEVRKNYEKADLVLYLPPDTPGNAKRFIRLARQYSSSMNSGTTTLSSCKKVRSRYILFPGYSGKHNHFSGATADSSGSTSRASHISISRMRTLPVC